MKEEANFPKLRGEIANGHPLNVNRFPLVYAVIDLQLDADLLISCNYISDQRFFDITEIKCPFRLIQPRESSADPYAESARITSYMIKLADKGKINITY